MWLLEHLALLSSAILLLVAPANVQHNFHSRAIEDRSTAAIIASNVLLLHRRASSEDEGHPTARVEATMGLAATDGKEGGGHRTEADGQNTKEGRRAAWRAARTRYSARGAEAVGEVLMENEKKAANYAAPKRHRVKANAEPVREEGSEKENAAHKRTAQRLPKTRNVQIVGEDRPEKRKGVVQHEEQRRNAARERQRIVQRGYRQRQTEGQRAAARAVINAWRTAQKKENPEQYYQRQRQSIRRWRGKQRTAGKSGQATLRDDDPEAFRKQYRDYLRQWRAKRKTDLTKKEDTNRMVKRGVENPEEHRQRQRAYYQRQEAKLGMKDANAAKEDRKTTQQWRDPEKARQKQHRYYQRRRAELVVMNRNRRAKQKQENPEAYRQRQYEYDQRRYKNEKTRHAAALQAKVPMDPRRDHPQQQQWQQTGASLSPSLGPSAGAIGEQKAVNAVSRTLTQRGQVLPAERSRTGRSPTQEPLAAIEIAEKGAEKGAGRAQASGGERQQEHNTRKGEKQGQEAKGTRKSRSPRSEEEKRAATHAARDRWWAKQIAKKGPDWVKAYRHASASKHRAKMKQLWLAGQSKERVAKMKKQSAEGSRRHAAKLKEQDPDAYRRHRNEYLRQWRAKRKSAAAEARAAWERETAAIIDDALQLRRRAQTEEEKRAAHRVAQVRYREKRMAQSGGCTTPEQKAANRAAAKRYREKHRDPAKRTAQSGGRTTPEQKAANRARTKRYREKHGDPAEEADRCKIRTEKQAHRQTW